MNSNERADLPMPAGDEEITIAVQPEGLLVGGNPAAVATYLGRLRESTDQAMGITDIDTAALGQATGLLGGVTSVLGQSGKFVKLSPDSVKALKAGKKIPGSNGCYRMVTRAADGKFLKQLQWKPTAVNPQRLMAIEMMAVQFALTSAIAQVDKSVRRVEDKVDDVRVLAESTRAGDVFGNHTTTTRMVAYLEKHRSLPDAFWNSVAGLGPDLNKSVERLRHYVTGTLQSFEPNLPVQDRAARLRQAVTKGQLGNALSLLVVSEDSLYQWHRLLLARVAATEPEHLPQVIQEARDLLAHQLDEDARLYRNAHRILDSFAKADDIHGWRFRSVRSLAHDREKLREDLDAFAHARIDQVDSWEDFKIPGVSNVVSARAKQAKLTASHALAAAGGRLIRMSDYLADTSRKEEPVRKDQPPTEASP